MSDETEELPPGRERSNAALAANREATQFDGEKANPRNNAPDGAGTKAWSIRNSIRYLAGQPLDMKNAKDAFQKLLPPIPTVAQVIAAQSLAKATKADMRAVEYVTEQIDGKLAQPNLNADLAAMENMTDEQLYDIIDRFNEAHARPAPGGEGDGADRTPPAGETPA